MAKQLFNLTHNDEISLKEIINFLIESWKIIFLFVFLGVLASLSYLTVTPYQYQATAQVSISNIGANNAINSQIANFNNPKLLMYKLKLPSSYSAREIEACGFENKLSSSVKLAESLMISVPKGLDSVIELNINRDNKQVAVACLQAIFDKILTAQDQIAKASVEESKKLLVQYQQNLRIAQSFLDRAEKTDATLSIAYFARRDEVRFLTEEISRLKSMVSSADKKYIELLSPIYINDEPVFPKKKSSLIIGLLYGLILGFLYAIARKLPKKVGI